MASAYQEEGLSQAAKEFHRVIASVIEELEAIDWYNQRADVSKDAEAKAIFEHNRDEEIEHAAMGLEWLRRTNSEFDHAFKTFLFTKGLITEVEAAATGGANGAGEGGKAVKSGGSLGIGSLK